MASGGDFPSILLAHADLSLALHVCVRRPGVLGL